MNSPVRPANEAPLADDLLKGAAQIAAFLFGDAKQDRRRIYWLVQNQSLPVFKIGGSIYARRQPCSVGSERKRPQARHA